MKILVKDSENNVMILTSVNGFVPSGFTIVPQSEIATEELNLARKNKLLAIRSERDGLLLENDKQWLIKKKKGQSTTILETEAQTLRDLPEIAEEALAELETLEDITAYNPFET